MAFENLLKLADTVKKLSDLVGCGFYVYGPELFLNFDLPSVNLPNINLNIDLPSLSITYPGISCGVFTGLSSFDVDLDTVANLVGDEIANDLSGSSGSGGTGSSTLPFKFPTVSNLSTLKHLTKKQRQGLSVISTLTTYNERALDATVSITSIPKDTLKELVYGPVTTLTEIQILETIDQLSVINDLITFNSEISNISANGERTKEVVRIASLSTSTSFLNVDSTAFLEKIEKLEQTYGGTSTEIAYRLSKGTINLSILDDKVLDALNINIDSVNSEITSQLSSSNQSKVDSTSMILSSLDANTLFSVTAGIYNLPSILSKINFSRTALLNITAAFSPFGISFT